MTDAMPDAAARGPRKSPTAYRTISEVSEELQVPQHVLRFWETKFNQVRPLKRGGGRRYYRPEDLELLRTIQALLYRDGYTIKGVQRLLREGRGRVGETEPEPPPPDLFEPSPVSAPPVAAAAAKHDGTTSGLPAATRRELVAILTDLKNLRAQLMVADQD